MTKVRVTKDRYTTDSLYQYDYNQELEICGLSLPSIPEIHFANSTLKEAIVKQSTMDDAGIIRVDIPNEILTYPNDIDVYVCIYEGDAFRVLYKFTIPINPKKKPTDYIAPDDEKVYSYNALENKLENTLVLSLERYDLVNERYEEATRKYDEALDVLEETVTETTALKESAERSATNALSSAQNAKTSEDNARGYAESAGSAENSAQESANNAAISAENARKTHEDMLDDIVSIHIGENGNWYIGDRDTGVSAKGEDGFSPEILVAELSNGYRFRITDKHGTGEYVILHGTNGKNGTSVSITNIIQSDEADGINTVVFSDGNMMDVKNGEDGYTPVKGIDYFTEADKAELLSAVLANFTDVSEVAL